MSGGGGGKRQRMMPKSKIPERESAMTVMQVEEEMLTDANYVAVYDLGLNLDIRELVRKNELFFGCRLQAAMACLFHPKSTALVFNSGKVLIVGSRSEQHAMLASWHIVKELKRLGYAKASVNDFRVANITATYKLRGAFDILGFARDHPEHVQFKNDSFPGVTILLPQLKIVLVTFASGSINITGAVHRDETLAVLDYMHPELEKYIVTEPAAVCKLFADAQRERERLAKLHLLQPKPTTKGRKRRRMTVAEARALEAKAAADAKDGVEADAVPARAPHG
jgi:transcription initiation factor TFIID TATA-box-binding protein